MKTLQEATKTQGVSFEQGGGLRLHFSPIPNWYGCVLGFDCPVCNQSIDWKWVNGKLPGMTTPASIEASKVEPELTGGQLVGWGHRWIRILCKCGTHLYAENFD